MRAMMSRRFVSVAKKIKLLVLVLTSLGICNATQATFINFDDLVYNPEDPAFYSNPLTDQYLSKGLLIDGGFLVQYSQKILSCFRPIICLALII